jgi:DNA-binding PadR family transcriptional regulator
MSVVSQTKKIILQEIKGNTYHGYILSKKLNIPISSIYEHLKELREARLIKYSKEGRRKIYQLTDKGKMLLKAIE